MGSAPEDSGSFCLKWNEFSSNISFAFKDLREKSELFDVTLLTKDGPLLAHKVILSACSDFFRETLKLMQPGLSPLPVSIFLRGVSKHELQAILEFMYQGEVNVTQDDLNDFLAVAEELQVKGLTNKEEQTAAGPSAQCRPSKATTKSPYSPKVTTSTKRSSTPSASKVHPQKKLKRDEFIVDPQELEGTSSSSFGDADSQIKQDPEIIIDPDTGEENVDDEDYENYEAFYADNDGDPQQTDHGQSESGQEANDLSYLILLHDGRVRCDLCNKLFSSRLSALHHSSRVHQVSDLIECCICKKVIRNKLNFRNHICKVHKIRGKNIVNSYGKILDEKC